MRSEIVLVRQLLCISIPFALFGTITANAQNNGTGSPNAQNEAKELRALFIKARGVCLRKLKTGKEFNLHTCKCSSDEPQIPENMLLKGCIGIDYDGSISAHLTATAVSKLLRPCEDQMTFQVSNYERFLKLKEKSKL